MPIITITSYQARTGRTSLVINLAFGLLKEGLPVELYDLGLPPGDLREWTELASEGVSFVPVRSDLEYLDAEKWNLVDLDWGHGESARDLIGRTDFLMAAVPLKDLRMEELLGLEEEVKGMRGGRGIDLLVPTMVNSHNWAENEPGMESIFGYFEEGRIADPLPF